jgi:hypothetical protein
VLLQGGHHFAIVFFPLFALRTDYQCGQSEPAGSLDATGVSLVRDYNGYASIGDVSRGNVLRDGLKIRAAAGEKNSEIFHGEFSGRQRLPCSRHDNSSRK